MDHSPLPSPSTAQISTLLEELRLSQPYHIDPLPDSTGAYHSIYLIRTASSPNHEAQYVLRISASHIPRRKTLNEVAMMACARQRTTIPLPAVIAYDCTTDNVLKSEYTLLEFCRGKPLSRYIDDMSRSQKLAVIDQIIDYLQQLNDLRFEHVGGLEVLGDINDVKTRPGPYIDVHFWTADDKLPGDPSSYNPYGPYDSFSEFCKDYTVKFWQLVRESSSLKRMRDMPVPDLLNTIQSPRLQDRLEDGLRFVLAHKDLHFGNILYDHSEETITAILDWELAAIVPHPLWNPGNFLWNAKPEASSGAEQKRLVQLFEERVKERGLEGVLRNMPSWPNEEQRLLWQAVTLLKRIVNGGIRGWQKGKMDTYRQEFEACVKSLVASCRG